MMPKRVSTWQMLWLNPAGEIARVLRFGYFLICVICGPVKVSVISPCFNERETIEQFVRTVRASPIQDLNPSNPVNLANSSYLGRPMEIGGRLGAAEANLVQIESALFKLARRSSRTSRPIDQRGLTHRFPEPQTQLVKRRPIVCQLDRDGHVLRR